MPRFNLADYDDVNSRIDKFWAAFSEGRILTEMVSDPNTLDEVVFKACIYLTREDERPVSVGWASEKRGKSAGDGANLTHHVENAETSAIGRALANLNFKTHKEAPRPSRQEMEKIDRYAENAVSKPALRIENAETTAHEPSDTELFNLCKQKRDACLVGEQKANIWKILSAFSGEQEEDLRENEAMRRDAFKAALAHSEQDWRDAIASLLPATTLDMGANAPTSASVATMGAMAR